VSVKQNNNNILRSELVLLTPFIFNSGARLDTAQWSRGGEFVRIGCVYFLGLYAVLVIEDADLFHQAFSAHGLI